MSATQAHTHKHRTQTHYPHSFTHTYTLEHKHTHKQTSKLPPCLSLTHTYTHENAHTLTNAHSRTNIYHTEHTQNTKMVILGGETQAKTFFSVLKSFIQDSIYKVISARPIAGIAAACSSSAPSCLLPPQKKLRVYHLTFPPATSPSPSSPGRTWALANISCETRKQTRCRRVRNQGLKTIFQTWPGHHRAYSLLRVFEQGPWSMVACFEASCAASACLKRAFVADSSTVGPSLGPSQAPLLSCRNKPV
jgi:hypothetical protein